MTATPNSEYAIHLSSNTILNITSSMEILVSMDIFFLFPFFLERHIRTARAMSIVKARRRYKFESFMK